MAVQQVLTGMVGNIADAVSKMESISGQANERAKKLANQKTLQMEKLKQEKAKTRLLRATARAESKRDKILKVGLEKVKGVGKVE